jgi:hypothetical protein
VRHGAARTCLLVMGLFIAHPPSDLEAQFAEPCELACAAILGATGFVAATGTAVAVGRVSGGISSLNQGLWVWGNAFAVVVIGGVVLSGNGERQRRAIYAAGMGTVAGALSGFALEALRVSGDTPRILAGTLIGATAGAVLGGGWGALSHDEDGAQGSIPLFSIGLRF